MKRFIFIDIIAGLLLTCIVAYQKDDIVPYKEALAHFISATQLQTRQDTNFNVEIKVPGMFQIEEETSEIAYTYARYAYYPPRRYTDAKGQITLEYSATVCRDKTDWISRIDSITRNDGYTEYSKSIRRQQMKFTYCLTYPSIYENSVARLKHEVSSWQAFGHDYSEMQYTTSPRHRRATIYHSGFATE